MLPGSHLLVASETCQRHEPSQSLSDRSDSLQASLTLHSLSTPARTIEFIPLVHGFGVTRLNTGTMTLTDTLIANFRTIRFPASDDHSTPPSTTAPAWLATAKARCADRLAVDTYRKRLHLELVAHGYRLFLDHLEPDPAGGWALHIFIADDHALSIVADISEGRFGPGDPVDFDPEEFVTDHLNRMERLGSDLA